MQISIFLKKSHLLSLILIAGFGSSAWAELTSMGYVADLEKEGSSDIAQTILKVAPNVLRLGTGSGTVLYRAKTGAVILWTASHIFPGIEGKSIDASVRAEPENMGAIARDFKTGAAQVYKGSFVFSESLPKTEKADPWMPSFDFKVIQLKIDGSVNNLPVKKTGIAKFILGYPKGNADLVYSLCSEADSDVIDIINKSAMYMVDENVEGVSLCKGIEGMSGGGVFDEDGSYLGHLIRGGTTSTGVNYIRYFKTTFAAKTLKLKMKYPSILE